MSTLRETEPVKVIGFATDLDRRTCEVRFRLASGQEKASQVAGRVVALAEKLRAICERASKKV